MLVVTATMDGSMNDDQNDAPAPEPMAENSPSSDSEQEDMDTSALTENRAEQSITTAPNEGPVPSDTILNSPQKTAGTTTTSHGSNLMCYPPHTKVQRTHLTNQSDANDSCPDWTLNVLGYMSYLADNQQLCIPGLNPYMTAHSGGDLVRQLPVDFRPAPLNLTIMPVTPRPVRPTGRTDTPPTSGQAGNRNIFLPTPRQQDNRPTRPSRPQQPRAPYTPGAPAQLHRPHPQGPIGPRPPHPHEPVHPLQGPPNNFYELINRAAARDPPLHPAPLQFSVNEPTWALGPGGTMKTTPSKSFPDRPPRWARFPPPFPETRSPEWFHMENIRIAKWYRSDIRWIEYMAKAGFLETSLRYGYSIGPSMRCGFVAYGEVKDYGERPIDLPAGPSPAELDFLPAEWNYIPAIYLATQDAIYFFTRHYQPVFLYCPLPPYNGTLWWNKGVTTLDIDMSLGTGLTDSEPDDEDEPSDDPPPDNAPGSDPSHGPRGPPPDGGSSSGPRGPPTDGGPSHGPRGPPPHGRPSSGHHRPSRKRNKRGHRSRPRSDFYLQRALLPPHSGSLFNELEFGPYETQAELDEEERMNNELYTYVNEDDDQENTDYQNDPSLMYVDETESGTNAATPRHI